MSAKLPLINLSKPISKELVSELKAALYQFGAFRLAAPETTHHHLETIIENARDFFRQPTAAKTDVTGYSPFASERVRGRTEIPKESIYLFRAGAESKYPKGPSYNLYCSVKSLHEEWTPIRLHLLKTLSQTLDANVPLTGTTLLDSATVGVHYYNSRTLPDYTHFNPAHMDSGTLTILFRSHDENDGLEIADLETTEKSDSEGVGSEASFIPVPTINNTEVVVFAGTRLRRLLGRDRVRACVHRVRGPGPEEEGRKSVGVQRLSIAMFCAPSVPAAPLP